MRTFSSLLGAGLFAVITNPAFAADNKVIVHEWGTFTCLQDEQGKAIGGINVDDEPVPYFVSQVALEVAPQYCNGKFNFPNLGLPPYEAGKAWISGDPQVTMRLETPVIYIYPPKGHSPQSVPLLDVHVDFHGGVLSQFCPHADFAGLPLRQYPENPQMSGRFPYVDEKVGLTEKTTTSLDWKGVRTGSTEKPREIDDKVWTTPREVSAPVLQVNWSEPDFNHPEKINDYSEAEHFLFYRGVGHLDSPLQVDMDGTWTVNDEHAVVHMHPQSHDAFVGYSDTWLVDIRGDGTCAFFGNNLEPVKDSETPNKKIHPGPILSVGLDLPFAKGQYSTDNLAKLKASMHDALVKEGLYDDEATAMLKTWDLSYFKSPGLRFFYIVPRVWVDDVLPMKVTGAPTEITRVMVGRIELITAAQKAALARLAAGPCPDLAAIKKAAFKALDQGKLTDQEKQLFYSGEKPLSELGITIPPLVQDYLSLGRFRDALIVREEAQHPSASLAQFIKDNQLTTTEEPYRTIPASGP